MDMMKALMVEHSNMRQLGVYARSVLFNWLLVVSFLASALAQGTVRPERARQGQAGSLCDRVPPFSRASRSPGDGGFRIQVLGHSERYSPGQVYTIALSGSYRSQTLAGFMLVAVPRHATDESTAMGTFQHVSASATRFAADCAHVVMQSDLRSKHSVEVLWTAPAPQVGCIEFRATVIEQPNVWYKDDGALTKVFCEDTGTTENSRRQDMVPDCCACGTAKYEMTFEGKWNQQSHPKDYPTQRRLLHWSNLVGASHSKAYMVWQYGAQASKGVKEVCEFGYPRTVEQEIRQHGREIRSIIQTTGIWYRDPHGLDQTRQARFSTDRRRHLVSMLTMLGPSPDWCVGISALDLCLPNCTWSGDVHIDLYPWDAGTDDGITYMAPNAKSEPQQKIHRLTNTFPDDPRSPFHGPQPIRPLAALRIQRLGPSEAQECADRDTTESEVDFIGGGEGGGATSDMDKEKQMMMADGGKCAMTEWEDWSSCSATCGVGQRFRKRMYIKAPMVDEAMCGLPTMESENCIGVENECETVDEDCAVTQWSRWSPCSVTCGGKGMRERRRYFLNKDDMARCDRVTEELDVCMTGDCTVPAALNYTAICALPSLSGPCRGDFERWYFDVYMQKCLPFSYGGCRGNANRFETMDECTLACQLTLHDSSAAPGGHASRTSPATADCLLPSDRGPCNRDEQLWFYDKIMQKCLPFFYGGCHGNRNRFQTEQECADVCYQVATHFRPSVDVNRPQQSAAAPSHQALPALSTRRVHPTSTLQPANRSATHPPRKVVGPTTVAPHRPSPAGGPPIKCVVSRWSNWSDCSATCGTGFQFMRRDIKQEAANGGKVCPRDLEKTRKCSLPSCDNGCVLSEWGPWSSCSKTCGSDAIQERERSVVEDMSTPSTVKCVARLQRRICTLPKCRNI